MAALRLHGCRPLGVFHRFVICQVLLHALAKFFFWGGVRFKTGKLFSSVVSVAGAWRPALLPLIAPHQAAHGSLPCGRYSDPRRRAGHRTGTRAVIIRVLAACGHPKPCDSLTPHESVEKQAVCGYQPAGRPPIGVASVCTPLRRHNPRHNVKFSTHHSLQVIHN
jgi:hypothetical protein